MEDFNEILIDKQNKVKKNKISYLKISEKTLINEAHIHWIKRYNNCLEICTKSTGCGLHDTHTFCREYNKLAYDKLTKHYK